MEVLGLYVCLFLLKGVCVYLVFGSLTIRVSEIYQCFPHSPWWQLWFVLVFVFVECHFPYSPWLSKSVVEPRLRGLWHRLTLRKPPVMADGGEGSVSFTILQKALLDDYFIWPFLNSEPLDLKSSQKLREIYFCGNFPGTIFWKQSGSHLFLQTQDETNSQSVSRVHFEKYTLKNTVEKIQFQNIPTNGLTGEGSRSKNMRITSSQSSEMRQESPIWNYEWLTDWPTDWQG